MVEILIMESFGYAKLRQRRAHKTTIYEIEQKINQT